MRSFSSYTFNDKLPHSRPKGFGTSPFSLLFLVGNLRVTYNSQGVIVENTALLSAPPPMNKVEVQTVARFSKVFKNAHIKVIICKRQC